jgi:uncharacterized protein
MTEAPRALAPFLAFPPALRAAGFAAGPDRTEVFIAAVGLIGPRGVHDIRRAAHAVFGPGPERRELFDSVFDAVFLGRTLSTPAKGAPEDLPDAFDAGGAEPMPEAEEEEPSGAEATAAERLFERRFAGDEIDGLRAFERALSQALPRRRSRRFQRARGNRPDPRRAFRQMLKRDGEVIRLPTRVRRMRQRRVLILVDVSGSMKDGTEGALRLAHALVRGGERAECFTLGTRLTRITRALRLWGRGRVFV